MPRQYPHKAGAKRPAAATWIVAADSGRARIFEAARDDGALVEIEDLLNAEARLLTREAVSDRAGSMARNAFGPRDSHAEHASEVFAKRLGRRLGAARRDGRIDHLYLLADPAFLGCLRSHLDAPTRRLVAQERATDVVRRSPARIRQLLPAQL